MILIQINPNELSASPWNTNRVSVDNQEKLKSSIEDIGVFKPVIVRELKDGTLEILAGEHRANIEAEKGTAEIPVLNLGYVDDERAKKIMLADNARYGSDDTIALSKLLEGMESAHDLAEILPWTSDDLANIVSSINIDLDELDDLTSSQEDDSDIPLERETKSLKTHEMLRMKFTLSDADRIRTHIDKVRREQGFTEEDDMTNAGDALIWLIFNGNKNDNTE